MQNGRSNERKIGVRINAYFFTRLIYPCRPPFIVLLTYLSFFSYYNSPSFLQIMIRSSYFFCNPQGAQSLLVVNYRIFFRPSASVLSFLTLFSVPPDKDQKKSQTAVRKKTPSGEIRQKEIIIHREIDEVNRKRNERMPKTTNSQNPLFRYRPQFLSMSYLYSPDRRLTPVKYYNDFRRQRQMRRPTKMDTARKQIPEDSDFAQDIKLNNIPIRCSSGVLRGLSFRPSDV